MGKVNRTPANLQWASSEQEPLRSEGFINIPIIEPAWCFLSLHSEKVILVFDVRREGVFLQHFKSSTRRVECVVSQWSIFHANVPLSFIHSSFSGCLVAVKSSNFSWMLTAANRWLSCENIKLQFRRGRLVLYLVSGVVMPEPVAELLGSVFDIFCGCLATKVEKGYPLENSLGYSKVVLWEILLARFRMIAPLGSKWLHCLMLTIFECIRTDECHCGDAHTVHQSLISALISHWW